MKFRLLLVDCAWTVWADWMDCSKTCGQGWTKRQRSIQQHAVNGGNVCKGENMENKICKSVDCPGYFLKSIHTLGVAQKLHTSGIIIPQ